MAEKVGEEIKKITPKDPDYAEPDDERMKPPYEAAPPKNDDKPAKPKGPTPSDPGFRIAIDDDDERRR